MTSVERNAFLSKYVGKENAINVNSLFESKLLLKNQKAGMISWAKKVVGMSPQTKMDMISRIERLQKVLDPAEADKFLHDLASTRLGLDVTQTEAKTISDLSAQISQAEAKAKPDGTFATPEDRMAYGASKVALEKYVNDIKLQSRRIFFKDQPVKKVLSIVSEIPGILKSAVASMDNSFWGRQGIKTFWDVRTTPIWAKNFVKSFGDIGKQILAKGPWYTSGDEAAMDTIKADIFSRPNAINGKYKAGDYGLTVLSEEAYPSSFPEKIPLLGRLFKASEIAYNGGALRLRADLADRLIAMAEKQGVNTLDPKEALGIGHLVSSLTGRGSIGKAGVIGKELNTVFFSVKFLKGNFDTLTAHRGVFGIGADEKVMASDFARKESAKSLFSVIAGLASVLTVAKLLNPDSADLDPRSTNFGKVKIFGHWTDLTGGMASLVTLASRLVPTMHNGELGFWTKNSAGNYTQLNSGKFGAQTAMDVFDSFWQGKLAPVTGLFRDIWKGQTYSGQLVNIPTELFNVTVPLSFQNLQQLLKDPASTFPIGSLIIDAMGFSTSTNPATNIKTGLIPEGAHVNDKNFIDMVLIYAEAMGKDPETAFNRIFTGQRIVRVTNGTVMVERMPLSASQDIKKKAGANNPQMKLDHTIPLELGGSNDKSNLKLVTTSQWSSYTKVENVLGAALKAGKITKKEAQTLIVKFKAGQVSRDTILQKYE